MHDAIPARGMAVQIWNKLTFRRISTEEKENDWIVQKIDRDRTFPVFQFNTGEMLGESVFCGGYCIFCPGIFLVPMYRWLVRLALFFYQHAMFIEIKLTNFF